MTGIAAAQCFNPQGIKKMRNQLFATAAVAAFFALTGAAHAQTVGSVGAGYSRADIDAGLFGGGDTDVFSADGSVAFDAGSLRGAVDGSVANFDADGGDATNWSVTGHLNTGFAGGLAGGF